MSGLTDLNATYSFDPAHTQLGFVVRHAMVTNVRGTFGDVAGTAVLIGSDPDASSVEVTMQVTSVDTGSEGRDDHLRSADFFDVETYPTIHFASTAVKLVDATHVDITGDLTIKDTTRQITLPMEFTGAATDPFGNERVGFEGEVKVSRKDYGLTWNAAMETGGMLVADTVKLTFEVSAIRA